MKTKILLVFFIVNGCLFQLQSVAQKGTKETTDSLGNPIAIVRSVNDLKSGNWQDVLTSFFQLGLSDLTGTDKSFNFKGSLFGIKLKTNPGLNVDTEYVRHSFDRNFQFNAGLRLDSQYRFNGFGVGFSWALVNKRDTSVINLIGTKMDSIWGMVADNWVSELISYRRKKFALKTPKDSSDYLIARKLFDQYLKDGVFPEEPFPDDFAIPENGRLLDSVFSGYQDAINTTRKKDLLTLNFVSGFSKEARFDSALIGLVYLKGLTNKNKNLELDLRANFNIKDSSLIKEKVYRSRFDASGGLNYALITNNKTNINILEVKPNFEYSRILHGQLPNEEVNYFYLNAEFRLHIFKEIWLPFVLKYDIKNSNVLGFLNFTVNWDALKIKK